MAQPTLLDLLPTAPYLLAYAVPLLLFSLVFSLAGTFLTLDRTRSFPSKAKRRFHFEGGVGGLIGGYLFGAHLSTALALLIPATTAVPSLSYKSFLAIWVLSVLVTTPLASRYRYVAYLFHGISGGTCTSLALIILIHPSLPSRIILIATLTSLFSLLALISHFIPSSSFFFRSSSLHPLHSFSRLCTASTGAFGLTQSIALLLTPPEKSWSSPWDRLSVRDGAQTSSSSLSVVWGNGREQGLSAAFWILMIVGWAADWALNRWIGECPDEKWDECLARYADGLSTTTTTNHPGRQGVFRPFGGGPSSVWERFFTRRNRKEEVVFTDEEEEAAMLKANRNIGRYVDGGSLTKKKQKQKKQNFFSDEQEGAGVAFSLDNKELLKKKKNSVGFAVQATGTTRAKKKPVRFGDPFSSDSDDSGGGEDTTVGGANSGDGKTPRPPLPPPPPSTSSSSAGTLVDRGGGGGRMKQSAPALSVLPRHRRLEDVDVGVDVDVDILDHDYDSAEEGILDDELDKQQLGRRRRDRRRRGEAGVDYSDYEDEGAKNTEDDDDDNDHRNVGVWTPGFLKRQQQHAGSPSLIKAIDRIEIEVAARRDGAPYYAYQQKEQEQEGWEEFWRDVASVRGGGGGADNHRS